MTASQGLAAALCLVALASGRQASAQSPPPDVATLQQAAACTTRLPPFGGRGSNYMAPDGSITMKNDGGWCWLQIGWTWRGQPAIPSGQMRTRPAHGTVVMGPAEGALRVAYHPAAGFTGHDFFRVRLVAPGQVNVIPVRVTVTP